MNEQIEKIREMDEKMFEIIEESFPSLLSTVFESDYRQTGLSLTSFHSKTHFIKNAIFDLCENDDLYSARILFRSLIEHFLRHQYIFIRFAFEKNDKVGEDFYKYCDLGENRDFLKNINSANKLVDDNYLKINVWDEIKKVQKDFNGIDSKYLEEKSNQFQYKNIIKYILDNIKDDSIKPMLQKIILNYSELSSFVHGGPFGEREMIRNSNSEIRSQSLQSLAELTFSMVKGIVTYTYLFAYQIDKKYGPYYNRLIKISI